ncbi:hypothetical protein SAMN05421664_0866 [Chryseobacterium soldanellicola]|uniref:Uncharacterized protein n=1 Tax=Chryseobacterium soldanellicola TaxID=311333 RepID=A0A1H0YQM6_9FLAO|nr:hypothetical protein [Chryseobacterium soldanellicola]SDQ17146.1 hypothetical protein SAMN05421664_0866 [Chryseobacterium soldanellicola]
MSKKGISQIKGPSEIRLGETAYYEVSRIYDLDDKKKVDAARWKLYVLDFKHHDNWRELKPQAGTLPKIGYRIPLKITKQSLVGSELMLEAYIYEPEKRIPPGLRIKVLPGLKKKISRVELFKADNSPIKEDTVMKYGQTIKVKVYTENMQGEMVKVSLYEDDAQGGGDSPKNKNNRVAHITKALNKKGFLWHEFKLNIDFTKISNAVMDGSHDKLHEYYVVVETAEHKSVSKNVEVQNPDYIFSQTVSSGVDTEKTYGETLIEEVVIKGKFKKQMGTNPPVGTGNQVVTVAKPDEKDRKKEEKCFCNKDFEEKDVRKLVKLLKGAETIWEGQALRGGKRAECNISDKSFGTLTKVLNNSFKIYNINTCAQKMHFLAQVCEETGTFTLSEETKGQYASSRSIYKGRGILQLTGVKKNKNDGLYNEPGPYKSYADYKRDQNIVRNPEIIATNVQYAIDSGGWIWSINQKMTDNPKSKAIERWGEETLGKSLNELAVYEDKYLELISALLNGRGSDGMPIGWEKRKSNYNLLKIGIFKYDWYHGGKKDQPVDANDITTYHIYADGKIERHIPKKIKAGYEQKYKYVYHDSNDKKYDICIVDWIEIDKVKHVGKSIVEKGYISHETFNVKGVNQKHVYKYADGRVIASGDAGEGGGTITRKYAKAGGKTVIIIKVPEPLSYNSESVKINLKFENTIRTYMGRDHFAALIGALANCNMSLISEGSAMKDGTCFPSVSHTNGESIDTDYLILPNTQKYVNSMAKFGFKTMLYKPGMKLKKPSGVVTFKEDSHHSAHLHCGSSNIPITEIKE